MTDFEPIYAALFAKVDKMPGLLTSSRKMKHWADVPAKQQPALFMIQGGETPEQVRGLPAKWRLKAELYLYVNPGEGKSVIPSQVMNPLIGAIRNALAVDNVVANACTLGGLVSHCWIAGEIEVYDGVLGDQAVAVVPIEILTA